MISAARPRPSASAPCRCSTAPSTRGLTALAREPAGHHLHVPELAGDPLAPCGAGAVEDHAAADAGAEGQAGRAVAPTGAERISACEPCWRRSRRRPGARASSRDRSRSGSSRQGRWGANCTARRPVDEARRRHADARISYSARRPGPPLTMVSSTSSGSQRVGVAPAPDDVPSASTTPASTLVPPMSTPSAVRHTGNCALPGTGHLLLFRPSDQSGERLNLARYLQDAKERAWTLVWLTRVAAPKRARSTGPWRLSSLWLPPLVMLLPGIHVVQAYSYHTHRVTNAVRK